MPELAFKNINKGNGFRSTDEKLFGCIHIDFLLITITLKHGMKQLHCV